MILKIPVQDGAFLPDCHREGCGWMATTEVMHWQDHLEKQEAERVLAPTSGVATVLS